MEPKTILVIEDNDVDRDLAITALGLDSETSQLTCVDSGEKALQFMRENPKPPDLILLDYYLPGMTGAKFLNEMRENKAWMDVPVIMLSGVDPELAHFNALWGGRLVFVQKPLSPQVLRDQIKYLELTLSVLNRKGGAITP